MVSGAAFLPEKLSRVSSYDALGNYALTPVGTAIAGPLASAFGSRAVLATGGALVVILPVLVLLVPEGRARPANDTWIAACTLSYGLPLATLNVKDFEDFTEHEGLNLIIR